MLWQEGEAVVAGEEAVEVAGDEVVVLAALFGDVITRGGAESVGVAFEVREQELAVVSLVVVMGVAMFLLCNEDQLLKPFLIWPFIAYKSIIEVRT